MKKSFLFFSIDPVQDFISQARKAVDLWAGSYMLSYLVAQAIFKFREEMKNHDPEFIFPDISDNPILTMLESKTKTPRTDLLVASIPNLFLCLIPNGTEESAAKKLEVVEKHISQEFYYVARSAAIEAFGSINNNVDEILQKQTRTFFNINYIIYSPDSNLPYAEQYKQASAALSSYKSIRVFNYSEETYKKCSLCGEREILHTGKSDAVRSAIKQWKTISERKPYICRENENLCGVCLAKRLGARVIKPGDKSLYDILEKTEFPSTGEVAAATFKKKLFSSPCGIEILAKFTSKIREYSPGFPVTVKPLSAAEKKIETINADGYWMHKENLTAEQLKKNFIITDLNLKLSEELSDIQKKLVRCTGFEPGKYYGIILMDGDNMGNVLHRITNQDQHKKFSSGLKKFSEKQVPEIIEQQCMGKLIYSGGDDVLAFVHPGDILKALRLLRIAFEECLKSVIPELEPFTASAGAVIAHYKTPSGIVMKQVRKMEKIAKSNPGKNAYALGKLNNSGGLIHTVLSWKTNGNQKPDNPADFLELLVNCRKDNLSDKFIYNFRTEFTSLCTEKGFLNAFYSLDGSDITLSILEEELDRFIKRASEKKTGSQTSKFISELHEKLHSLVIPEVPSQKSSKDNVLYRFDNFINFLLIMNFLAEESMKERGGIVEDSGNYTA